jgi:hypothetical protein
MLNETWFPTPEKSANIIKHEIDFKRVYNVLDPSAGRGDLLIGALGRKCEYDHRRLYDVRKEVELSGGDVDSIILVEPQYAIKNYFAIELDPSLRGALSNIKISPNYGSTQSIKLIGSDFLNYNGHYDFDLILMNPPFDRGDEHLLKAISIVHKAQILCILNKETINNPFDKTRKLLKNQIDKYAGKIIDLGKPFTAGVERKANVECVLVKLDIDTQKSFIDLDFSGMKLHSHVKSNDNILNDIEDDETCVVERNEIKAQVAYYNNKISLYKDILQAQAKLNYYCGNLNDEAKQKCLQDYHNYVDEITINSWKNIVSLPRFTKYMTKGVKDKFFGHIENNSYMEFSEENIYIFLDSLVYSFKEIMEQSLLDLFDKLTSYDKKNVIEKEGWWTNDAFRVNKRIIIPRIKASYSTYFSLDSNMEDLLNDMDRIMMYLSGEKLEDKNNPHGTAQCRRNEFKNGIVTVIESNRGNIMKGDKALYGTEFDSHFFKFRLYKKPEVSGTIHLEFKDEKLWQEFNIRAALKKNWLPDDYKARRKDKIKKRMLLEYK